MSRGSIWLWEEGTFSRVFPETSMDLTLNFSAQALPPHQNGNFLKTPLVQSPSATLLAILTTALQGGPTPLTLQGGGEGQFGFLGSHPIPFTTWLQQNLQQPHQHLCSPTTTFRVGTAHTGRAGLSQETEHSLREPRRRTRRLSLKSC